MVILPATPALVRRVALFEAFMVVRSHASTPYTLHLMVQAIPFHPRNGVAKPEAPAFPLELRCPWSNRISSIVFGQLN